MVNGRSQLACIESYDVHVKVTEAALDEEGIKPIEVLA